MTIKYCEDCKHFRYRWLDGKRLGQCTSTKARISILDGEHLITRKNAPYASIEHSFGNCGIEGKNWEAKE